MTDTTSERQRIVALIAEMRDHEIRDSMDCEESHRDEALRRICQFQECIDKIMEATDD